MYRIQDREVRVGFHKGELAGKSPDERKEIQVSDYCERYHRPKPRLLLSPKVLCRASLNNNPLITKAPVGATLEEVLSSMPVASLRSEASRTGISIKDCPKKADVIAFLLASLPTSADVFKKLVDRADAQELALIQKLLKGETISRADEEASVPLPWLGLFAFTSKSWSSSLSFMPPELVAAFSSIDLGPALERRKLQDAVRKAFYAHITLCGIAPLEDVFAWFKAQSQQPVERADFDKMMEELLDEDYPPFILIEGDGGPYVANPNLVSSCYHGRRIVLTQDEMNASSVSTDDRGNIAKPWPPERLANLHQNVVSRLVADAAVGNDIASFVYGLPCVKGLISYFDSHVPYDEDEYFFADAMVDDLINRTLFRNESLKDTVGWLTRTGWFLSEGGNAAPLLTKLIVALYRDLPRWEYNGWSESEYLDLMGLPTIISETQLPKTKADDEGWTSDRIYRVPSYWAKHPWADAY